MNFDNNFKWLYYLFYCIIVPQIVHSTYHYLKTKDPMVFIILFTYVLKLLCYVYIGNMIFVTTFKKDYFLFILPCLQLYIVEFVYIWKKS